MSDYSAPVPQTNISQFEDILSNAEPKFDPIEQSQRVLDNTAFYDFSFYEFLFPTELAYQGSLSERALATLDDFQASDEAGAEFAYLLLDVLLRVEQSVRDHIKRLKRRDWNELDVVQELLEDFYLNRASLLPDILESYQTEIDEGIGPLFLEFLKDLIASYLRSRLYQSYPFFYGFWSGWAAYFQREFLLWHEAVNPPPEPPPPKPTTGDQTRPERVEVADDPSVDAADRGREENPRVVNP